MKHQEPTPNPAQTPSPQPQSQPVPPRPPFIPYQKPNTPPPPPPYYVQPGGYPSYPGMPYPPKPKTKLATASLVLGSIALGLLLLGLFGDAGSLTQPGYQNSSVLMGMSFYILVCGLLALIFGLVSRSRFRYYPPNFPGRRNSLLGIIFGAVSLGVLVLIYLLAFALIAYLFALLVFSI